MTHDPERLAELAELRTRARAAAELLHAQHLGALTSREARRIESVLERPIGKVTSLEAEAVLHLADRILPVPACFPPVVHKRGEPLCDTCDGDTSK